MKSLKHLDFGIATIHWRRLCWGSSLKPMRLSARYCVFGLLIAGTASLIFSGATGRAALLTTTDCQPQKEDWNAAIWRRDGSSANVTPGPGDSCVVVYNGSTIRKDSVNARVRNPIAPGQEATFPADSLMVTTNTELRLKPGFSIVNFPGVGGKPGLIVDGGMVNLATKGGFTIKGVMQVESIAFIDGCNREGMNNLELLAQIRGGGTLVFLGFATNQPNVIGCDLNSFSGKWVVAAGWLTAQGKDCLGTNDITIDPLARSGWDFESSSEESQAVLELGYDIHSAGTLTLKNGGVMHLHRNCSFAAVIIEGLALTPGMYPYADLVKSFPKNFLPGGSGSVIVQPYRFAGVAKTSAPASVPASTPARPGPRIAFGWYVLWAAMLGFIGLLVGLAVGLKRMPPDEELPPYE
jgi:hypothetical protein